MSKKVLQLILEHQNGCNEEFKKIQEILEQIKIILELCRTSRRELKMGGSQFSASLGILANYRKRKLAQNLLNNLNMIKNLVRHSVITIRLIFFSSYIFFEYLFHFQLIVILKCIMI